MTINNYNTNQHNFLIVIGTQNLGGSERQALNLAKGLKNIFNASVSVVSFDGPGIVSTLCKQNDIPCNILHKINPDIKITKQLCNYSVIIIKMIRFIRHFKIDYIIPFTYLPNFICSIAWHFTSAKACIWNQRDETPVNNSFFGRFLINKIPVIISNSQPGKHMISDTCRIDSARIEIIHNGIDIGVPKETRKELRKRFNISETALIACMIGNITNAKDHVTLLYAWQRVKEQLAVTKFEAVLFLAGLFGNAYKSLSQLIELLRLKSDVYLLGCVEDVAGLLYAVDFGVFSSKNEGCPNGILECMDAELALAATDIPGIREALSIKNYDLLSPPGDIDLLANNIIRLICDKEMRKYIGKANKQKIEQEFSMEAMVRKTVSSLITASA